MSLRRPTEATLRAEWNSGERTPAWEELWRRILSIATEQEVVAEEDILDHGVGDEAVKTDE